MKAKTPLALPHGNPRLVNAPNLGPVESSRELSPRRNSEPSGVVADGWLGNTQLPSDLGDTKTLVEKLRNGSSALPGWTLGIT
jgi:hypothetical protein